MTQVSEVQFEYKITKIQTVKFFFEEIDDSDVIDLFSSESNLGISINTNYGVDRKESSIVIEIHTLLIRRSDEKTLVEHVGRTKYQVNGLESVYNPEKDAFDIPDGFIILISSIAFTHSRALLAVEISSTCYKDKYFLPIINPTEVFGSKDSQDSNTSPK